MSTALQSPASTAATAAVPSAASETTKPGALQRAPHEQARAGVVVDDEYVDGFGRLLLASGHLGRVVERFELGQGDGALRAQLGHARRAVR